MVVMIFKVLNYYNFNILIFRSEVILIAYHLIINIIKLALKLIRKINTFLRLEIKLKEKQSNTIQCNDIYITTVKN